MTRQRGRQGPLVGVTLGQATLRQRAYGPKMSRLLAHVRANGIAYLALFIALSGTSYAATQLPAKSVGAKQLKANAVTTAKVKDGNLTAKDFKAGQLPAGATGPAGPAGPAGGAAVVARARFTGDQVGTSVFSPVPLTGGGYTQAANELDQFYAVATIDVPGSAACSATTQEARLTVQVGSLSVLTLALDSGLFDDPETVQFTLQPVAAARALFEPGTATPRAVTAIFFDSCDGASRYHLRNLKVDVVGVQ